MMTDHEKILQSAEEASKVVQDPELRKIAFQEIVRNELQKGGDSKPPVKERPASSVANPKTPRAKPQSKGSRAVGTRDVVQKLDISPDEKELPSWSSTSQDWKKFCWILEAARRKNVDGLTSPEISYLIDRIFRENYTPAQVNNLKKKITGGFVRVIKLDAGGRSVDAWKILSGGITELKKPAKPA